MNGIRVGAGADGKLVGTDGPLEAGTLSGAGPPVPFGESSREMRVGMADMSFARMLHKSAPGGLWLRGSIRFRRGQLDPHRRQIGSPVHRLDCCAETGVVFECDL